VPPSSLKPADCGFVLYLAVFFGAWNLGLAANLFVLSLAAGAVFGHLRSLWACIIGHNANDFVSFVLFHGRQGAPRQKLRDDPNLKNFGCGRRGPIP
jgi:uncharacterized membrane protein YdjX (TVP38/TMEM64 family)